MLCFFLCCLAAVGLLILPRRPLGGLTAPRDCCVRFSLWFSLFLSLSLSACAVRQMQSHLPQRTGASNVSLHSRHSVRPSRENINRREAAGKHHSPLCVCVCVCVSQ